MEIMCSTFNCDIRHGHYCCATCPRKCENACLNGPERCGMRRPEKTKPKRDEDKRGRKSHYDQAVIANCVSAGMRVPEIARRLGVGAYTARRYIARWRGDED